MSQINYIPSQIILSNPPASPPAGYTKLYKKDDGLWYELNSLGAEVQMGTEAGAGNYSTVTTQAGTTYTAGDNLESIILCDCTSNNVIVTLPAAAFSLNRLFQIKKTDSSTNSVVIDGNASETIDGIATVSISTQYECITVVCDGTEWWIV